ncbi:hypothetical protein ONZ45_g14816 [Pleurotus djamor]|nr:hypothetical protein ONZ45_g14816 [Pleurotus djamor]
MKVEASHRQLPCRQHPYRRRQRPAPKLLVFRNFGIQDLPIELLVKIFLEASVKPDGRLDYTILLKIGLIHRDWYGIIVSTPAFWTNLSAASCPSVLVARLSHTFTSPLYLVRNQVMSEPLRTVSTGYILDELHRFRTLNAWFDSDSLFHNHDKLHANAPVLESLELLLPYGSPTLVLDEETLFGGVKPPRLRHLRLRGVELSWSSTVFTNLTNLNLDSQPRPSSYSELCDIFSRLQSLKVLNLFEFLPLDLPLLSPDTVFEVSLPNLCEVVLNDDIGLLTAFMAHFKAKPRQLAVFSSSPASKIPPLLSQCSRLLSPFIASADSSYYWSGIKIDFPYSSDGPTFIIEGEATYHAMNNRTMDIFYLDIELPKDTSAFDIDPLVTAAVMNLPIENVNSMDISYCIADVDEMWFGIIGPKLKNVKTLVLSSETMYGFLLAYALDLDIRWKRWGKTGKRDVQPFDGLRDIIWAVDHDRIAAAIQPYIQRMGRLREKLGLNRIKTELIV